jgi:hypothetical protein
MDSRIRFYPADRDGFFLSIENQKTIIFRVQISSLSGAPVGSSVFVNASKVVR